MSLFSGKECVICKKLFTEDDTVVVCPECGAPHHKECYAAKGSCGEVHLHGTEESWSKKHTPTAQSGYHDCPRCGCRSEASCTTCPKCGERFLQTASSQAARYVTLGGHEVLGETASSWGEEQKIFGVSPKEIHTFVHTNSDYYMEQFHRMKENDKQLTWNWSAFFLGPFYLLYRKLYKHGLMLLAVTLITFIPSVMVWGEYVDFLVPRLDFESTLSVTDSYALELTSDMLNPEKNPNASQIISLTGVVNLMNALRFGIAIAVAMTTNKLYLSHTLKKIKYTRAALQDYANNPNYLQYLRMMGGTNLGATLGAVAICLTIPLIVLTAMISAKMTL